MNLQNWCRKSSNGNITMLERLSSFIGHEKCEEFDKQLKSSILKHFQSMESWFQQYFSELIEQEATLAKNPFSSSLQVTDILDKRQDEFRKFITDSSACSI